MQGIGYELNEASAKINQEENAVWCKRGAFEVRCKDFLHDVVGRYVDLVFSHNVIEHLTEKERFVYFDKAKQLLTAKGKIITVVPAGREFWGIEDEIAGHILRFEREDIETICKEHGLRLVHLAYLTYPLSNWLKPLGDRLIRKSESGKLSLTAHERTIASSNRGVEMKTQFHPLWGLVLNKVVLAPFILLQWLNIRNRKGMSLYFELEKI